MPLSYQQALAYIHSFDDPYLAAIRDHGKQTWGLDGIRAMLDEIDNPHLAYPTLHVAGTKGKGSTCAFIAQALMASGLKTGLYTSPHLQDWRERIQINRTLIEEEALARLVEDAQPFLDGRPLSAFEVTTALAFWHFAREGCDAAVIEVGLGGRLDATSVVEPIVAVITSLSLDHIQFLGDTLAQIAAEKAAIVKRSVPVVSAPQAAEAQTVIEEQATRMNSRLTLVGRDWHFEPICQTWQGSEALIGDGARTARYTVGLPGTFQIENAAVALAALREARREGMPITEEGEAAGLANVEWPARLEVVAEHPRIVLDGAHNPYSIARLIESLGELRHDEAARGERLHIIFGCMSDKDVDGMLKALLPAAQRVIFTHADHPRAAEAADLLMRAEQIVTDARLVGAEWASQLGLSATGSTAEAIRGAQAGLRSHDTLCITGSLSIAGEARTLIKTTTG